MALGTGYAGQGCFLARALEVVGERWTLLIVRDCCFGVRHFNDFLDHLEISRAVLADRLETLVDAGVLERRPDGRTVEYLLTAAGEDLWPTIYALHQWGGEYLQADHPARLFSHTDCGTDLDAAARCPACDVRPALGDITTRPGKGANDRARSDHVAVALSSVHPMLSPIP